MSRTFGLPDIGYVEIFPPIGIARVGDAKEENDFYFAPEVPGLDDPPSEHFRSKAGKGDIKRQAVRFRVYAYDKNGTILGEINNSANLQGYKLSWTVHVANKKAAYNVSSGLYRDFLPQLRNPDVDRVNTDGDTRDPFTLKFENRANLIIDPGKKTIERGSGPPVVPLTGGYFIGSTGKKRPVQLGELRTDEQGRLIFLGSDGHSYSVSPPEGTDVVPEIISEFDSVDWYDSTCDGWLYVEVTHAEVPKAKITSSKATIISSVPKFAWGLRLPTSLYDIIEDIYHPKPDPNPATNFYKDIWPVILATYKLSWVDINAFQGHGTGAYGNFQSRETKLSDPSSANAGLREYIFNRLREPNFRNENQAKTEFMPRLSGDNGDAIEPGDDSNVTGKPIERFAALTELQYNRFKCWKDGNFETGKPFDKTTIEEYPLENQPLMLTVAMLETTVGNPLYPGIETYWIAKLKDAYILDNERKLDPPFRIDHHKVLPGFLTRGLSLPWQSDFDQCNTHWWPAARPEDIVRIADASAEYPKPRVKWDRGLRDTPDDTLASFFPGSTDMVNHWNQLGFVVKKKDSDPPEWYEVERTLGEPQGVGEKRGGVRLQRFILS
ncbi:hypothetical protein GYMLUDRAFT_197055 [Collybiopsis luxurians FD-317 M1]|uniref:L-lysine 6-oxidase n=1 Tax=Collybiopsis luxurians FD-317 M1 TaxID=944289 RepID=A0A0D0CV17_9AGAR|nr:hypothetical protein GYMLUDRAFT_197055 [Collybiopsis luxurians FD-317 M1]